MPNWIWTYILCKYICAPSYLLNATYMYKYENLYGLLWFSACKEFSTRVKKIDYSRL